MQTPTIPARLTVYPALQGGFPPASFWDINDSLRYIRLMQDTGSQCGLCSCPASSFESHYADTLPRNKTR